MFKQPNGFMLILASALIISTTQAYQPHHIPIRRLDIPREHFTIVATLILDSFLESNSLDFPIKSSDDQACIDWMQAFKSTLEKKLFDPAQHLTDLQQKTISYSGFIFPMYWGRMDNCRQDPLLTPYAMVAFDPAKNAWNQRL